MANPATDMAKLGAEQPSIPYPATVSPVTSSVAARMAFCNGWSISTYSGPAFRCFVTVRKPECLPEQLLCRRVGMAPLRAIIHDQLERRSGRKISFFYGARSRIDVFHAEEFDDLARRYANFSWTLALSEPAPEDHWDGPTGFVHSVVFERFLKTHEAPEECEYYLCGPPLMIQAVSAVLDTCGVDEESVFADDFGS